MKFLVKTIIIAAIAYFASQSFPWYSVVIAAFLGSLLIRTSGLVSFVSGFLAIGLLWFTLAWLIDFESGSLLTKKVAAIFQLSAPLLLVLVTGLVGGIAGGFGALTGTTLRQIFEQKRRSGGYYK
ncbi:hypothetical protein [Peijinzhouia sedimentorum]